MTTRGTRAAAVAALSTGALVATALPSYADSTVWSSGYVNYANFVSYGEHLYNCDRTRDGHHAVVQWYDGVRNRTARNYGGVGTCQDVDLDLPEGRGITYLSCVGEGTRIYACGPVRADRA